MDNQEHKAQLHQVFPKQYSIRQIGPFIATLFVLAFIPISLNLYKQDTENRGQAQGPNPETTLGTESVSTSPVRGQAGDLTADIILGKTSFSDVVPNTVVGNKFFYPRSVIVDRSSTPNRLYIYDGSNSRIIGIRDINKCTAEAPNCQVNAQQGDIVIGQPNFNSSACNTDSGYQFYPSKTAASASTLCNLPVKQLSIVEAGVGSNMYVSAQGDLYVNDMENSRVLKYIRPFETDTIADDVWGQNDFSGTECNKGLAAPDATSLCTGWANGDDANNNWAAGVEVDSAGNLWVADNKNHRVLRFPPGSHTADLVLGQTSFTTRTYGSGLNQIHSPSAVRVNNSGWVYVADYQNSRILRYKTPSTGAYGEKFGPEITQISGLDWDPTQPGKIWAANKPTHTYDLIDETTGQVTRTLGTKGNGNVLSSTSGSIGIDSDGNYYVGVPQGDNGNDIVTFPASGPFTVPSKNLFNGRNIFNARTASGLIGGLGVVSAGNQLIVQDWHGRIVFWNDHASLSNGKPADGVLEITDLTGWAQSLGGSGGLISTIKASKNHLYVARGRHDKPLRIEVYTLPLTNGQKPLPNYLSYPFNVINGTKLSINTPDALFWGLAPTQDDSYLWVSHSDTNRVFRIKNPLTQPVVDIVLGQSDVNGIQCNRGAAPIHGATLNSLCMPGSLSFDKLGNLYVSDHSLEIQGNMRMLIFSASTFPANPTSPIFAPTPTYVKNSIATWEPAFDSNNKMVVGYNPYWVANPKGGWFPGVYNNPLSNNSVPDAHLTDYHSMAIPSAFDAQGNLYVGDADRSRVLVYKQPFGTPISTIAPSAFPTNTPASVPSSTPVLSTIPTKTPTRVPSLTASPTSRPSSTPGPTGSVSDTTPPQVQINSPQSGAILKRNSNSMIVATASDVSGISRVEFVINGTTTCTDTQANYECSWKLSGKPGAAYTIVVRAYDKAGNMNSTQTRVFSDR